MSTVRLRPDPPGISIARKLICQYLGKNTSGALLWAEREQCRSTPQVLESLQVKAAVPAGSTAGSHWGDDLAPSAVGQEFFSLLQSASAALRLLTQCRRAPFHVKVPKEVGAGMSGAWRGEGLPRPIARTTTDTITQSQYEAGVIVAATKELMRFGATTEVALRDLVLKATAKYLDGQLFDPTVTASANVRPASITNGAPVVTTAGTSAANIITDLSALIASIGTPGDSLRWVMRPITFYTIAARLAGVGMAVTRDNLLGIPTILSSSVPNQITLVDADSIIASYDDAIDVSISTEADLEMLDGSLQQSGLSGTGASMVSLFQSGLVAIKAEIVCAWQAAFDMPGSPVQPAGVAYCVVTY